MRHPAKQAGICLLTALICVFSLYHTSRAAVADGRAVPDALINITQGTTLVLGSEGKYLLRTDNGAVAPIPENEWLLPNGYFDSFTKVRVEQTGFLRSVIPAQIGPIIGDENSGITFVSGSNITINTQEARGISVGNIVVGDENSTNTTVLSVTAASDAISYFTQCDFYSGAQISAQGVSCAILSGNEDVFAYSALYAHPGSNIVASASGKDGVAIRGYSLRAEGSSITATAPQGSGGIWMIAQVEEYPAMVGGTPTQSRIDAFSLEGRAIHVGYQEMSGYTMVYGSIMRGITEKGEAGISSATLSVHEFVTPDFRSEVYGSADVGFGIAAQTLDSDSEYPGGGLDISDSSVVGNVNEGMGISSFLVSSYSSVLDSNRAQIQGIAQKGIGVSICMGSFQKVDIIGKSYGSTTKHFQVYDSIADSAGLNFLSGLYINDNVSITAEAPMEDPRSYGIHGLLNYYDGSSRSGYLSAYSYEGPCSITAKGGAAGLSVGVSVNLYGGGSGEINLDLHGAINGIETDQLHSQSDTEAANAIFIRAVGDRGAGVVNVPLPARGYTVLDIVGTSLQAMGGQYGINIQIQDFARISDSEIVAIATGQSPEASGVLLEYLLYEGVNSATDLVLANTSVTAKGRLYGWHSKNFNIKINNEIGGYRNLRQFTAQGGESGILLEYDSKINAENIAGLEISSPANSDTPLIVKVVSDGLPPDQPGRKAAVFAPVIKVSDKAILLEDYLIPISKNLDAIPYMAYAQGQNIADLSNYNWLASTIPITASSDGLTTTEPDSPRQIVLGVRSGNNLEPEESEEPVSLSSDGKHQVKMLSGTHLYTVTFDTDGGGPQPPPQEVEAGGLAVAPTDPVRSGYVFSGWHQDPRTAWVWHFDTDRVVSDMTLYARWIIVETPVPPIGIPEIIPEVTTDGKVIGTPHTNSGFTIEDEAPPLAQIPDEQVPLSGNPNTADTSKLPIGIGMLLFATGIMLWKGKEY